MAKTITLGDTEVPRIGLGTNRLRLGRVDFVREAVAAGVGAVDTAHLYTGGESEQAIGEALSPAPKGCVVATKGGFSPGQGKPDVLGAQIEESLRRLQTDRIELYYLHRVDPETPLEQSLAVLAEYRKRGQIRHIGLSEVGVEEIERAREVVPIVAVQNRYNLGARDWDEVVDYCAENGIVFVAFYPLREDGGKPAAKVAKRHGATPAQVALAWLLARSPAVLPIPGTLSLDHLRENLGALELELSDEDLAALA